MVILHKNPTKATFQVLFCREQLKELQGQYDKVKEERDHLQIFYDRRQLQVDLLYLRMRMRTKFFTLAYFVLEFCLS